MKAFFIDPSSEGLHLIRDASTPVICSSLDVASSLFVFYGGTLRYSILVSFFSFFFLISFIFYSQTIHLGVTHVIVDTRDLTRLDDIQTQIARFSPVFVPFL